MIRISNNDSARNKIKTKIIQKPTFGGSLDRSGVSKTPGAIVQHLMLMGPNSRERGRVIDVMAPFEAE